MSASVTWYSRLTSPIFFRPPSPPLIPPTGTRVPRMIGLPCCISGSVTTRLRIGSHLHHRRTGPQAHESPSFKASLGSPGVSKLRGEDMRKVWGSTDSEHHENTKDRKHE